MKEAIGIHWATGATIYCAFWCGGQVFKFGSGTFENYSTTYNAEYALTLTSLPTSQNRSLYWQSDGFDLNTLEKQYVTDIGRVITVCYYLQAGANPLLQSDQLIHEEMLQVQFGHQRPALTMEVQPNLRSDLTPESLELMVTLLANGKPVDLSGVSGNHLMCFELTREGEEDPFIAAADTESAVRDDGRWLLTLAEPGLTSGRGYQGRVHYRTSSLGTNLLTRSFSFLGCG